MVRGRHNERMFALHNDPAAALPILIRAAEAAGAVAMAYFQPGATTTARVDYKDNNSPVTEADLAANKAALAVIAAEMPGAALFSEEIADNSDRFNHADVVVIDPIDGTRAFIQGRSEWCVSIALMRKSVPVAGVIHAPARGETFAAARGGGASLNGRPLPRRTPSAAGGRITGPRPLLDTLAPVWPAFQRGETYRALAYRLATVAAGCEDVAVATEGAHDWDIAAAEVLLCETGCALLTRDGARAVYNASNPVHPALVAAEAATAERLITALSAVGAEA
ncbi:MAG: 3'(2'),5'-bisphosphate nucleotidase CysQ [Proteobacteria bacterium]|nr:3'(2'),5'-bisphosphate nucleotidase CysQ [Pseudomonadota bacterium]